MVSLEYIAGFFDGEGSIGIYHRKGRGFHLRTQLVQNHSQNMIEIYNYLVENYGGNLSSSISITGKQKLNWQLNADKAVRFLNDICPHLRLKQDQALIAIDWQNQRPKVTRNAKGQLESKAQETLELDLQISNLLKELKG